MRAIISMTIMRIAISMKTINHNDWSLLNKLKTSMLIEPSVGELQVYLYFFYFVCSPERVNRFYYRLVSVLYNILDEDGYFSEDC
jgi:hypothetical protein